MIETQLVALMLLGLVIVVAAALAWHRRRPQPAPPDDHVELPGSRGQHELQRRYRSQDRASRFCRHQVLDRLNDRMIAFIGRQEMVWIATADGHGECDCSFRAGPAGFVQVLDAWTMRYPEYRGNGSWLRSATSRRTPTSAWSSWTSTRNGSACTSTAPPASSRLRTPTVSDHGWNAGSRFASKRPTYLHCRKHLPHLVKVAADARAWGTDDARAKGGDYFGASCEPRPWTTE